MIVNVSVFIFIMFFLRYLHEVCQPIVAHKNFKSTNILLDEELNVRVSDCGLAPLLPSSHISKVNLRLFYLFIYLLWSHKAIKIEIEYA